MHQCVKFQHSLIRLYVTEVLMIQLSFIARFLAAIFKSRGAIYVSNSGRDKSIVSAYKPL